MASITAPTAAPVAAPFAILFPVEISSEKFEHSSRSFSYCAIFTPLVSIIGCELSNIELELFATQPEIERIRREKSIKNLLVL